MRGRGDVTADADDKVVPQMESDGIRPDELSGGLVDGERLNVHRQRTETTRQARPGERSPRMVVEYADACAR